MWLSRFSCNNIINNIHNIILQRCMFMTRVINVKFLVCFGRLNENTRMDSISAGFLYFKKADWPEKVNNLESRHLLRKCRWIRKLKQKIAINNSRKKQEEWLNVAVLSRLVLMNRICSLLWPVINPGLGPIHLQDFLFHVDVLINFLSGFPPLSRLTLKMLLLCNISVF